MSKRLVSLVSSLAFLATVPLAAAPGCGSAGDGTAWLAALVAPLSVPMAPTAGEPGPVPLAGCVEGSFQWFPTGGCCSDLTEQEKFVCQGGELVPVGQFRCRPPLCF